MSEIIQAMQVVVGLLWLIPTGLILPGFIRVWRNKGDVMDALRLPILAFAFLQFGFSVRWFFWPHALPEMTEAELVAWGALYILSGATAVWITTSLRVSEKMRP